MATRAWRIRGADDAAPEEDGVWRIDLDSGDAELVLALAEIVGMDPDASMAGQIHWLNHAQINTDGSRLAVLHRWAAVRRASANAAGDAGRRTGRTRG